MSYTREGIMMQVCVAFGQGTGELRVSQVACQALNDRYLPMITDKLVETWDGEAVQVLERIRAIGRMAGATARLNGQTQVGPDDVVKAAKQVELISDTAICGPPRI